MPRWFWYMSPQKLSHLKQPATGWGFLRERFGKLEIEAGVPWAKLSSKNKDSTETSLIATLEKVENEIRWNHRVPSSSDVKYGMSPLFFDFYGKASRLILRESYAGNDGDCVFLMVGIQDRTGVILLGSGSNVPGSTAVPPRFVDPSIDPVGALLVKVDISAKTLSEDGWSRAGIARDASDLSLEETVLYSFCAALKECQKKTFFVDVHALVVFTAQVQVEKQKNIENIEIPDLERVIIGSPIYVEQLDSEQEMWE